MSRLRITIEGATGAGKSTLAQRLQSLLEGTPSYVVDSIVERTPDVDQPFRPVPLRASSLAEPRLHHVDIVVKNGRA